MIRKGANTFSHHCTCLVEPLGEHIFLSSVILHHTEISHYVPQRIFFSYFEHKSFSHILNHTALTANKYHRECCHITTVFI